MNARPETAGKESSFIGFGIVEDLRLEIGISLLCDGVVPTVNAFFEQLGVDAVVLSKLFERGKALDGAIVKPGFDCRHGHVLFHVGFGNQNDCRVADCQNGVGSDLPIAGFIDKAFAGFRVNHETVADRGFDKLRADPETFFIWARPRTQLNPIHQTSAGSHALRGLKTFTRRCRAVCRIQSSRKARVVHRAHLHILRKTAGGEYDTAFNTNELGFSRLFLGELIVGPDLNANDCTVVIGNKVEELRAQTHRNLQCGELREHRADDVGSGAVHKAAGACDRMAALKA